MSANLNMRERFVSDGTDFTITPKGASKKKKTRKRQPQKKALAGKIRRLFGGK